MKAWGRGLGFAMVLLVSPWLGSGSELRAQSVEGTVLSSFTGTPIETAQLRLVTEEGRTVASMLAGPGGQFRISPPRSGAYFLHGEALGYLSFIEGPFELEEGAALRVELVLRPAPLAIDSVHVSVEGRNPRLELTGFYDRLALGQGFHLDRRDIEDRPSAQTVSDFLRGVPGVQVDNRGNVQLRGMSSIRGRCYYKVYLDGILMVSRGSWDEEWPRSLIHPNDIEALEVYSRPSQIPIQYGGAESGCGIVLIWSRR